jgi:hypothetical protein
MFGIDQQERGGRSHGNDLTDVDFDAMTVSDQWAAYGDLGEDGNSHCAVYHKDRFVNPDTLVHTQRIESLWSACKRSLSESGSKDERRRQSDLKEWCWRSNRRKSFERIWFDNIQ